MVVKQQQQDSHDLMNLIVHLLSDPESLDGIAGQDS